MRGPGGGRAWAWGSCRPRVMLCCGGRCTATGCMGCMGCMGPPAGTSRDRWMRRVWVRAALLAACMVPAWPKHPHALEQAYSSSHAMLCHLDRQHTAAPAAVAAATRGGRHAATHACTLPPPLPVLPSLRPCRHLYAHSSSAAAPAPATPAQPTPSPGPSPAAAAPAPAAGGPVHVKESGGVRTEVYASGLTMVAPLKARAAEVRLQPRTSWLA